MNVKGCTCFLYDRKSHKLKLYASVGLSKDYIEKGLINYINSIAFSLKNVPLMIYSVSDDPRIQHPKSAKKEGIASILCVPMVFHGVYIGALEVYTKDPWEASLKETTFIQAIAKIASTTLEMRRLKKGLKASIELIKSNRDLKKLYKVF